MRVFMPVESQLNPPTKAVAQLMLTGVPFGEAAAQNAFTSGRATPTHSRRSKEKATSNEMASSSELAEYMDHSKQNYLE